MKNRFVHYGIVLLVIAAISAGILGKINDFTKTVIAENKVKAVNEARREVLSSATTFKPEEAKTVEDLKFIPGFNEAGDLVGYVVSVSQPGYAANIDFVLGITKDGKVAGLNVISSQETPGLGARIGEKEWQNHWKGIEMDYNFNKATDAFAGATISPRAVYTGIIRALKAYDAGVRN